LERPANCVILQGPSPRPRPDRLAGMTISHTTTASVLIIEDNSDVAESLARFLRIGCGYDVNTEGDGVRGMRAALADPPDVVILDIGLPKKNGILVGEELIESLSDRPLLIAVTGYGDATTRALAEEAGFDHFLIKPADPFAIEELIEAHLKRRADVDEFDL
jgi:DNA-binding response OmpR family regulator